MEGAGSNPHYDPHGTEPTTPAGPNGLPSSNDQVMTCEPSTSQGGVMELMEAPPPPQPQFKLRVDTSLIKQAQLADTDRELEQLLTVGVFNQQDFEQGVIKQVDDAIAKDESEREAVHTESAIREVRQNIQQVKQKVSNLGRMWATTSGAASSSALKTRDGLKTKRQEKLKCLKELEKKEKLLLKYLEELKSGDGTVVASAPPGVRERVMGGSDKNTSSSDVSDGAASVQRLVELGEITPFTVGALHKTFSTAGRVTNLSKTKRKVKPPSVKKPTPPPLAGTERSNDVVKIKKPRLKTEDDDYRPGSDEESVDSDGDSGEKIVFPAPGRKKNIPKQPKKSKNGSIVGHVTASKLVDDHTSEAYTRRVQSRRHDELVEKKERIDAGEDSDDPDYELDGGLVVPGRIWAKLYKFQKTGVRWLWELHCQQAGGIVGDEMGLGKTIQVIAFLAGLRHTGMVDWGNGYRGIGPTLVVCPTTVLHQWVREFHKWSPSFRVAVFHDSGCFSGRKDQLVHSLVNCCGVMVTSYSYVRIHVEMLSRHNWHYVVLDEGHKIRNPDAVITLAVKQFKTCHRLILSGSPVQNNLKELWSLFDFVFPGKLGTLPVFLEQFSVPITLGGYSNASPVQVQTAYKCACVLRDTINPYLLRRMKADVKMSLNLPGKNEQVLFCRLTDEQRELYTRYLASEEVQSILSGNYQIFVGLINLRKICNHPDLVVNSERSEECEFGSWKQSGKMIVIESLLKLWRKQNHKVLLFSQSRQMLNILQTFLKSVGYTYLRMDGTTPISSRQVLVNRFNSDASVFVFLLTTKVGGVGVNLTGADRVVIYDPDWNPSTDTQARERAWRIGQDKDVTIYRLLTAGTIEEKIYHRQIFKQFLTNRVLKDPKQRRFFKSNDMMELFTLGSDECRGTETSAIFAGTGSDVRPKPIHRSDVRPKPNHRPPAGPGRSSVHRKTMRNSPHHRMEQKYDMKSREGIRRKQIVPNPTVSEFDIQSEISNSETADTSANTDENCVNMKDDLQSPELRTEKNSFNSGEEIKIEKQIKVDEPDDTTVQSVSHNGAISAVLTEPINTFTRTEPIDTLARTEPINTLTPTGSVNTVTRTEPINTFTHTEPINTFTRTEPINTFAPTEPINTLTPTRSVSTSALTGVVSDVRTESDPRSTGDSANSSLKNKYASLLSQWGIRDSSSLDKLEAKLKKKKSVNRTPPPPPPKSKKFKKKSAAVEGHEISNLVKLSVFQETDDEDKTLRNKKQDEYVIQQLFQKTGMHSAMQHDTIMNSSASDYMLVEQEAERVASEAARALRKSRQHCSAASPGVPTWTGSNGGQKPRGKTRPRFGKKSDSPNAPDVSAVRCHFGGDMIIESSATKSTSVDDGAGAGEKEEPQALSAQFLLSKMRARNNSTSESASDPSSNLAEDDELMVELRNFVAFQSATDGEATTAEILEYFTPKIAPHHAPMFKAMLNNICNFMKRSDVGVWVLKQDYR